MVVITFLVVLLVLILFIAAGLLWIYGCFFIIDLIDRKFGATDKGFFLSLFCVVVWVSVPTAALVTASFRH